MKISEADFTRQLIDLAHLTGWRVAHFRPAQTARGWRTPMSGDIGYPDLTLAKGGRLIVAELKAEGGSATPEQVAAARHPRRRLADCVANYGRPRIHALLKEGP